MAGLDPLTKAMIRRLPGVSWFDRENRAHGDLQWPRITVGDGDRAVSRRFDYSFLESEIEGLPIDPDLESGEVGYLQGDSPQGPGTGIWNFGMLHRISRCLTQRP